jgi:hypothetical protein
MSPNWHKFECTVSKNILCKSPLKLLLVLLEWALQFGNQILSLTLGSAPHVFHYYTHFTNVCNLHRLHIRVDTVEKRRCLTLQEHLQEVAPQVKFQSTSLWSMSIRENLAGIMELNPTQHCSKGIDRGFGCILTFLTWATISHFVCHYLETRKEWPLAANFLMTPGVHSGVPNKMEIEEPPNEQLRTLSIPWWAQ